MQYAVYSIQYTVCSMQYAVCSVTVFGNVVREVSRYHDYTVYTVCNYNGIQKYAVSQYEVCGMRYAIMHGMWYAVSQYLVCNYAVYGMRYAVSVWYAIITEVCSVTVCWCIRYAVHAVCNYVSMRYAVYGMQYVVSRCRCYAVSRYLLSRYAVCEVCSVRYAVMRICGMRYAVVIRYAVCSYYPLCW
jgi:hypothetical protein